MKEGLTDSAAKGCLSTYKHLGINKFNFANFI